LRQDLTTNLNAWARQRWPEQIQTVHVQFEPADIVNQVMSLGANMPVEVSVRGAKLPDVRGHTAEVKKALEGISGLADVQTAQSLEYPTLGVKIDREAAAIAGIQAGDVARALVAATSSTRFTLPVYWRDPGNGIGYQVQVEVPVSRMSKSVDIDQIPLANSGISPLAVRDVGKVVSGEMPAQIDRFNMKREVRVTANLEGRDLASARQRVVAALAEFTPPAGVETHLGGQLEPMARLGRGLAFGGVAAIVAIALLVLAYFQSVRLVVVVLLVVPGVLAGLCIMLLATGTTVSLPSLMGAILALGVGVAHAILYLSKARAMRWNGLTAREASAQAVEARARPILMTGMAMLAGMAPMALGGGETGVLSAPLARAVMGGLTASIVVSLLVLPSLFACLESGAPLRELSLDPDRADAGE
jgi:multidrug efflux pump subunit AcrB